MFCARSELKDPQHVFCQEEAVCEGRPRDLRARRSMSSSLACFRFTIWNPGRVNSCYCWEIYLLLFHQKTTVTIPFVRINSYTEKSTLNYQLISIIAVILNSQLNEISCLMYGAAYTYINWFLRCVALLSYCAFHTVYLHTREFIIMYVGS